MSERCKSVYGLKRGKSVHITQEARDKKGGEKKNLMVSLNDSEMNESL